MTAETTRGKGLNGDGTVIRIATLDDAPAIATIYRHYVETSAATFEYVAPDDDEIRRRMTAVLERYPYFVAVREGIVVGFTYAAPLRTRPAYDWSCETTIYVAPDRRATGVGRGACAVRSPGRRPETHGHLERLRLRGVSQSRRRAPHRRQLALSRADGLCEGRRVCRLRQQVRTMVRHSVDEEGPGTSRARPETGHALL